LRIFFFILNLPPQDNPNNPKIKEAKRILQISYSPASGSYISNTPPPALLSVSAEARSYALEKYTNLCLGPCPAPPKVKVREAVFNRPAGTQIGVGKRPKAASALPIPIHFSSDMLYISTPLPAPLFSTHVNDLLFYLSTSSSRHHIQSLAFDLRVWNELTENGLIGILARMKALREVCLVVEFGRSFAGELGFLEAPEWRGDLRWVAERAEAGVREERVRARDWMRSGTGKGNEGMCNEQVSVRCVLLTRGGEQA
jgi:hypothetical protein